MILFKLAIKSLRNGKVSSVLTIFSIAISVFLLLSVERIKRAAEEGFTHSVSQVDLLVGARTGPLNLILYTVFNMGSASNNISWESYQEIKSKPEIAWTIPYSLGDGHKGFRIVATDENFYEHYRYRSDKKVEFQQGLREFSDQPVPREVIENAIMTAASAPSGAHKQPWHFCVVADPAVKKAIRAAAEEEEYQNYHGRMTQEWLDDLLLFGTDWHKAFLETAPYLIVVFKRLHDVVGIEKRKNYYVPESVGIACGFLLAAIHQAGLVALPHTPSPMNFLNPLLHRPAYERPFLLLVVGYPADDATVPAITKKPLEEIATFI